MRRLDIRWFLIAPSIEEPISQHIASYQKGVEARNQGISVLGSFVSEEDDLVVDRKIYGKEFVYTSNVDHFAHIVGTYLRKQMEQE